MKKSYDEILQEYRQTLDGEEVVYIKRDPSCTRLLVSLATHNNHGKYASLVTYHERFSGDLLFLADTSNSYYLENDQGVRYKRLVSKFLKHYTSENIVFTGSSMAGYAALSMALHFNSNAVVNNPQVNLDVTLNHSWAELGSNIMKIAKRENLEEKSYVTPHRNTVVAALFGRHELDAANMPAFFELFSSIPGLGLIFGHCYESAHGYNYPGIDDFLAMVEKVIEHRRFMSRVNGRFAELSKKKHEPT